MMNLSSEAEKLWAAIDELFDCFSVSLAPSHAGMHELESVGILERIPPKDASAYPRFKLKRRFADVQGAEGDVNGS